MKRTLRPFWQAASPSATWVLPVPLGPTNDVLYLSMYSQRASSTDERLVQDRLEIEADPLMPERGGFGNFAALMRRSTGVSISSTWT